ncbi:uncharacterized protein LOC120085171 isoform X1 [Benincasa hispida]|uniref:uncharacterized protein LOC120085171 isoform X1 n=1 Tax=Benincasa hispida TaxID=102211 RepID=UPI001900C1A2|nr:uncharacterized protein LOC120085171 isoform X1 [Benincasa hispida]
MTLLSASSPPCSITSVPIKSLLIVSLLASRESFLDHRFKPSLTPLISVQALSTCRSISILFLNHGRSSRQEELQTIHYQRPKRFSSADHHSDGQSLGYWGIGHYHQETNCKSPIILERYTIMNHYASHTFGSSNFSHVKLLSLRESELLIAF